VCNIRESTNPVNMSISGNSKGAQPQITLTLDEDNLSPFYPGSRVSGTVSLQIQPQNQLQSAEVVLSCRSFTTISRTTGMVGELAVVKFTDNRSLFRLAQPIQPDQSSSAGENGHFEWRFD